MYGSDIEDFVPTNYDFIPEDKQKAIINYITELDKEAFKHHYADHTCTVKDLRLMHRRMADEFDDKKQGFIDGLEKMGIFLRFGWPRHRDEWFLCTLEDIEMANDFIEGM